MRLISFRDNGGDKNQYVVSGEKLRFTIVKPPIHGERHHMRTPNSPSDRHVSMRPSPSDDLRVNGQSSEDINGKNIATRIIDFTMEKYPLHEAWPEKHEKVPDDVNTRADRLSRF